jgi:hypothetical protein
MGAIRTAILDVLGAAGEPMGESDVRHAIENRLGRIVCG